MKRIAFTFLSFAVLCGCSKEIKKETVPVTGGSLIRYDYSPGEIARLTDGEIKILEGKITGILSVPDKEKNFQNTFAAFDNAFTDFDDATNRLTFMNDVSTSKPMREEALKSEMTLSDYSVNLGTRRDIYNALIAAEKNIPKKSLNSEDARLVEETIKGFKRNGLFLPDNELQVVKDLQQKLGKLTSQFSDNAKEKTPELEFTREELKGVPQTFLDRLEKSAAGNYKVKANKANYPMIMENSESADTRKKMLTAFENIAAEENTKLLVEIISLRQQIAKKLYYKTWADYKTEDRMAKNAKTADDFLEGLKSKLAKRNRQDAQMMLKYKKTLDPSATHLNPWDIRYLEYQIKKKYYSLDDEVIREYFPADHVVAKMFEIYSTLLGVKFVEIPGAGVWSTDVKLYEVKNTADGTLVGHFYADFYPRDGKYNHFAAFSILSGRNVDGAYRKPVSAIVANFEPPANGRPSLLNHEQVETLFHEFGHIMHQTLTKANYGSLAGSRVARDFVEAPSQMLENWVWDKDILKSVSGHFKNLDEKLPDSIADKLIETRNFNKGTFYTRQLLFGIFDMTLHMSKTPISDPTGLYKKLYKELTGIDPLPNTHFPATFTHLMGYDAGYYGYLWSEVYADDMFTLFEKDGLLSAKIGEKYRHWILEKGDTAEADKLIKGFLGRNPNNKAFLKKLLDNFKSPQI